MNNIQQTGAQVRTENRRARDMEFVAMYNPTLQLMIRRGVSAPRRAAIRFVIHNGHPRYHVSYKRAYEVVRQLVGYGKMPILPSLQAEMWHEIADRVAQLCQQSGVSIACALEFVLEHCRASRFFFTESYADSIIDKARCDYRRTKYRF